MAALDYAEELLGRPSLCDQLYGAVMNAARGHDTDPRAMGGLGPSQLAALQGLA